MKKLFTANAIKLLESLSFTPTLYAFDFDGTLSRIVQDPSAAVISKGMDLLLQELSTYAPVAIVSGRSIEDLKNHLKFVPPYLIGNHGLEGLGTRPGSLEVANQTCRGWNQYLKKNLPRQFEKMGIEIEDKTYSIALHYRKSQAKKKARMDILEVVSSLDPRPRIIMGKCVVNILPTGAPHKGVALVELMLQAGIKSAFYIGDDDTDEDVFSLPNARIMTVRVGKKSSSQAQFYIQNQSEVGRLLRTILRFYKPSTAIAEKRESLHGHA